MKWQSSTQIGIVFGSTEAGLHAVFTCTWQALGMVVMSEGMGSTHDAATETDASVAFAIAQRVGISKPATMKSNTAGSRTKRRVG